jgi:tRNA dimethylallyltransferase
MSRVFENPFHRAIYLTGPTACGKSAVGVALAHRLGGEILALDSMTLYRGMDIGTAKPTLEEREGIPHHLIDILDPWESASVAEYRVWAREKILEVEARGRLPIFVGGTALYLKTLLRGLFEGPGADPSIRLELENEAAELGSPALHSRLATLDPVIASRLHPNDSRRIVRALEVIKLTGSPLSRLQSEHDRPAPAGVRVFAMERPRPDLYDRINRRVEAMFHAGLVEEVRRLMSAPRPLSTVTAQAVGYRQVIDLIEGRQSLELTIDLVQTRTRQFAKRQGTWFRGLSEIQPLLVEEEADVDAIADRLAEAIRKGAGLEAHPDLSGPTYSSRGT